MATNNAANIGTATIGKVLISQGAGVAPVFSSTPLIDSTGRMTNSNQPCFLAYLSSSAGSVTGDGTSYQVAFDTVVYDQGTNFTTGSSAHYTFPIAGKYLISFHVGYGSNTATTELITLVATSRSFEILENIAVSTAYGRGLSVIVDASASDTVKLTVALSGGTKASTISGTGSPYVTFISGCLIC